LFEALGDPHIDVIGDFGAAVAPEQYRAPDSISSTSVGFDGVSELPQPRRELQQYIVAVQPGSLISGPDARFDSADHGDERFHPLGRVAGSIPARRVGQPSKPHVSRPKQPVPVILTKSLS